MEKLSHKGGGTILAMIGTKIYDPVYSHDGALKAPQNSPVPSSLWPLN